MQGIYEIRNRENDKIYIGSSNNITKRWEQHICNLTYKIHHSYKLQQDWNKYGFDNFEFRIIELVKDKKDLLKIEQKWIDALDIEESYNVMSYTNYKGISVPIGFIEAASYSESISQDIKNKLKNNIKIFNKKNEFHIS
jgi:group I intron endonuclease